MPGETGLDREYDWTTTAGLTLGPEAGSGPTGLPPTRRLEFAAFSVKSMPMTSRGDRFGGGGGAMRLFPQLALALALLIPGAVSAQMFSDRPPPVPPSSIPDAPGGPAMNLAPPSGSLPSLPPTLTQPTIVQP